MEFLFLLLSIFAFNSTKNYSSMIEIGQYQNEAIIITYGQIVQEDGDVDGAIYIEDIETDLNNVFIEYDDLGTERFIYVADVGNSEFIAVCERYYKSEDYQLPVFKDVVLIKYDRLGNRIGYISLETSPKSYHNHHYFLVVEEDDGSIRYINNDLDISESITIKSLYKAYYRDQFQGVLYINDVLSDDLYIDYPGTYYISIIDDDYEYNYEISVSPEIEIIGDEFENMFINGVYISSLGTIYVNGDEYFENEYLTTPGNYVITVYGLNDYIYQEEFILLPNITYNTNEDVLDFMDGLVVNEPLKIYSNGISMFLDGNPYFSELITEAGSHAITVYGINGMQYTLSFDIVVNVTGVTDGGVYDSVNFIIYGQALLNGESISGDVYLDTPGNYQLDLIQNDEVYETINFEIEDIIREVEDEEEPSDSFNFNYILLALIAIGGYLILRKK